MKKITTRNMVLIALLSGVSYLFYIMEFNIAGPLKFDFSDLFVMVAGYSLGVVPGILVALIKNIIHFLGFRSAGLIGEVTNFTFAVMIMVPIALIRANRNRNRIALAIFTIVVVSVGINIFNYFVSMPIYGIPRESRIPMILAIYLQFNLIKTSLLMVLFHLIRPLVDKLK